jgi:hypothetical protein
MSIALESLVGPWRPIPKPRGFPSTTNGPAVSTNREPAAVAADPTPAAQAVMDAAACVQIPDQQAFGILWLEIAAALRAAADQVVPDGPRPSADSDYHLRQWSKSLDQYAQRQQTRAELLAIAAELEKASA